MEFVYKKYPELRIENEKRLKEKNENKNNISEEVEGLEEAAISENQE